MQVNPLQVIFTTTEILEKITIRIFKLQCFAGEQVLLFSIYDHTKLELRGFKIQKTS